MVRLNLEAIARGTSRYSKKKRDETTQQYLKRLTHLYLEDRNIDEVGDDLSLCRNLVVLYMYDNKLTRIPNLNGNNNLTHLYLQNNNLMKMEGLNCLQKLSKLYIGGNCITVLEGVEKLELLQELHMENQKLPFGEKLLFDPRSVVALSRSLQILNISGNNLDSIQELQCLTLMTQFMAGDNHLNNMKDLAQVLGSWRQLWRVELMGNPLCHKSKYKDRVIIMAPMLEILDGKEVTETEKKFLRNWQASREAQKRKQESVSQGTNMEGSDIDHHPYSSYTKSSTTSAANRLGNDVPGYIMPALPRKQFQEVLARSMSQPSSALAGNRVPAGPAKYYSEMNISPRFASGPQPGVHPVASDDRTFSRKSSASHKISLVHIGSNLTSGDSFPPPAYT